MKKTKSTLGSPVHVTAAGSTIIPRFTYLDKRTNSTLQSRDSPKNAVA